MQRVSGHREVHEQRRGDEDGVDVFLRQQFAIILERLRIVADGVDALLQILGD